MKWNKASYVGFMSPQSLHFFSGIREGIVVEGNKISIEDEHFLKYDDSEVHLQVGTLVLVKLNRWFYFMSKVDYNEMLHQNEMNRLRKEEEYRLEMIARREDAERFNSQYQFPFKWEISIKAVLTGLTERSMGNGAFKSTVYHVLLKSKVNEGKIKRNAGDFLCTSKGGNNGNFSELIQEEYFADADGVMYKPKITCKSCLKLAERWKCCEF